MANDQIQIKIELKDFSDQVKQATTGAIKRALNACGAQGASFAVENCTAKGVVDTGLLRNSLTWALGGRIPKKRSYSGDHPSRYRPNGKIPSGRYEGRAPDDEKGINRVYIGTNVEYAVYQEMGFTHYLSKKKYAARPYLRPALEDHVNDYKTIITDELSKLNDE